MTSHASVNVMLALEDHFDIEFPDRMLTTERLREHRLDRARARRAAIGDRRPMSVSVDRDQAFLELGCARSPTRCRRPNSDAVDRGARFPTESIEALRGERALSAGLPDRARWRRRQLRGDRGRLLRARAPLRLERDGLRDAPDQGADARPPPRRRTVVLRVPRDGSPTSSAWSPRSPPRSAPAATWAARSRRSHPARTGTCTFEKKAPVVSYGAHADDLFVTLRRAPDSEPSDQVIALAMKGQAELEPAGTWDPLGMRGTCSPGFVIRATIAPEQVLPAPVLQRHVRVDGARSPTSSGRTCGSGIATDAFDRARAFVRASAKAEAAARRRRPRCASRTS